MLKARHAILLTTNALILASCSDPTSPTTVSISIDFCSTEPALWFAYQNEDGPWTRIVPDANGTVTFAATLKVTIAYTRAIRGLQGETTSSVSTSILHASASQLETISGVPCVSEWGSRTATVSSSGLAQFDMAYIGAHRSQKISGGATGPVARLPDQGPLDFFAIRIANGGTGVPLSAIIRRGVTVANGGTLPVFDFASSEAVPIVQSNLTVNRPTGGFGRRVSFWTGTDPGKASTFLSLGSFGPTSSFPSIPPELTQPGDVHELSVFSSSAFDSFVAASVVYRIASDKSVALGPELSAPTVVRLETTVPRFRSALASQGEYGGMMVFSAMDGNAFTITTTAEFHGQTPSMWQVEMPDFTVVDGWNGAWNLRSDFQGDFRIAAFETAAIVIQPAFGIGTALGFDRRPYAENSTVHWAERIVFPPPNAERSP
jgi:hypothetical protein